MKPRQPSPWVYWERNCLHFRPYEKNDNLKDSSKFFSVELNLSDLALTGEEIKPLCHEADNLLVSNLYLSFNRLSDIKHLFGIGKESFSSLVYLDIGHNKIKSLDGCEKLKSLKLLDCSYNSISDIKCLRNMTKLTKLNISHNLVAHLNCFDIAAECSLTELFLHGNPCWVEGDGKQCAKYLQDIFPTLNRINGEKINDSCLSINPKRIQQNKNTDVGGFTFFDTQRHSLLESKGNSEKETFAEKPIVLAANTNDTQEKDLENSNLIKVGVVKPKSSVSLKKNRNLVSASKVQTNSKHAKHCSSYPQEVLFTICYSDGKKTKAGTAVEIRRDGSAVARWPNGTVAISIEQDTAGYFKSYACTSKGVLALIFDDRGTGSINYDNGKSFLTVTKDRKVYVFDKNGSTVTSFVITSENSTMNKVWKHEVEDGLAFLITIDKGILHVEIFFKHRNVHHRFIHGFNSPCEAWEHTDAPRNIWGIVGHTNKTKSCGEKNKTCNFGSSEKPKRTILSCISELDSIPILQKK